MLGVHAFESGFYSIRALLRLIGFNRSFAVEKCVIILSMTTSADGELLNSVPLPVRVSDHRRGYTRIADV